LTIGLAGFDLQLVTDESGQLRIGRCVPPDRFVRIVDRDRIDVALARQLESFDQLSVERKPGRWILSGNAAALAGASKLVAGMSRPAADEPASPQSAVRLTLKTVARRSDILQAIASQQGLTLVVPPGSPSQLVERVSVDADQVTLEQLVGLVLDGSGFAGRIVGQRLEIVER
jgi:hypothetical protein